MGPDGTLAVLTRVLANRDLRRVLVSYFAFNIAECGTWVAILLYAYEVTGPGSVGIVALLQLVPAALAAAPAAALGDRYPRHRVLAIGYLGQAAAMLGTAAAMLLDLPVAVVYASAIVAATALVVTRPTQSALLPSLARTPDELTAANGAAGIVEGLGVLVGPLVAAIILTGSSVGVVFLVAGGSMVAAALATLGLQPRPTGRARRLATVGSGTPDLSGAAHPRIAVDAQPIADGSFRAGLRTVASDPDARLIVGLLTAKMFVLGSADVLFILLALDLLDMGEPGAGLLNAALGAGTVLGGALAFALVGRQRLALVALLSALVWGVTLALIGLTALALLAPLLFVAGGAGLTILEISGRTLLQRSIRNEVLARVFGIQEGLAMVALAAGSVLVAVLVELVGLVGAVVAISAILPVVAIATWSRLSSIDRRAVPPVQALDLLRRTPLFRPLAPPELEGVARHGRWLTVPAGTAVITAGEIGDRYFVIADGAVAVTVGGAEVGVLDDPGAGFGEIALLLDVPRTATVTATRESVLFAIDRAPFLAVLSGDREAMRIARSVVAQQAS